MKHELNSQRRHKECLNSVIGYSEYWQKGESVVVWQKQTRAWESPWQRRYFLQRSTMDWLGLQILVPLLKLATSPQAGLLSSLIWHGIEVVISFCFLKLFTSSPLLCLVLHQLSNMSLQRSLRSQCWDQPIFFLSFAHPCFLGLSHIQLPL